MIVVFGSKGQLGACLAEQMGPAPEHVFLSQDSQDYCGDLSNVAGLTETLMDLRPDMIINAAAYTNVDGAQNDPATAVTVNAKAPALMAQVAAKIGSLLVHYSTDYVFDGSGSLPHRETDACAPLSVYGQSKLEGELNILASGCRHYILRTSWLYGVHGKNFITSMLDLATHKEEITVVADQWGAPTSTELVALSTLDLINLATPGYGSKPGQTAPASGLYHCTARGETTWHAYASLVIQTARDLGQEQAVKRITPVSSADWARLRPAAAPRPANSRLSVDKLEQTIGRRFPDWQEDVMETVGRLLHQEDNA